MRIYGKVEIISVLIAVGVTEQGARLVLGLQMGDKVSASSWRELFKDLKKRGPDGSKVVLGIMDGLPGLEKVFQEEFPHAQVQRCQVHIARNVLGTSPETERDLGGWSTVHFLCFRARESPRVL